MNALRPGEPIPLDRAEAHHARDVLRLTDGAVVEVFDDAGNVGTGVLVLQDNEVCVAVQGLQTASTGAGLALTTVVVPPTNFAINYLWSFRAGGR